MNNSDENSERISKLTNRMQRRNEILKENNQYNIKKLNDTLSIVKRLKPKGQINNSSISSVKTLTKKKKKSQ